MLKITSLLFFIACIVNTASAQQCDCTSNFEWVKKTFEQNDAGFQYALKTKGTQAYEEHNKHLLGKVKTSKTIVDCGPVLYEWLTFFRSGHIAIRLINQPQQDAAKPALANQFPDWEMHAVDIEKFKSYLNTAAASDYEGIWETEPYTIGIKKQPTGNYIGFIMASGAETWKLGQVKLKFSVEKDKTTSVYYMRDHSAVTSEKVSLIGKNHLRIGNVLLAKQYPKREDEPVVAQYIKSLEAKLPYFEQLNPTTCYLRIPSFNTAQKRSIDSVLAFNRGQILKTENFIIDIRNGTGGSDASYKELLPFLYTNPIRTVGTAFLSTQLNNQRMLDFINKPEYGFSEEDKVWAKKSYEKLDKRQGAFVNLGDDVVSITALDTVYTFPKNVGIIINEGNGSTDEQFLLAAKQSKKVKLFGTTTYGVLDISNMYFVASPCNEFELGYALSRSMRIPDFSIDGKGIQPDYYLDSSIPLHEWTGFVNKILNQ